MTNLGLPDFPDSCKSSFGWSLWQQFTPPNRICQQTVFTKKNAPPDGRALGAFSSAVCLVGLRFGSDAPRPWGGLILGCRNQHAEPNLIVRAHHTMCGVLRLFRSSTRLLTGRRTKPLILSALLNNPRYLTGDFPQKAL